MLLRASEELGIDLARSWLIGDILDDVEAGHRVGCRTVLVDLASEARPDTPERDPDFVARNTTHGLRIVAEQEGLLRGTDLDYRPARWLGQVGSMERLGGLHGAA